MKLIIASDIHGAADWCGRLMSAIEVENPDRMVLLGDLLYHGPRNDLPADYAPKRVIEMLNGIADRVIAVRGNCEAEVDQMVLEFPVLADYALLALENKTVFLTHGHVFNENHLPPLKDGDILLHGHTHVPCRHLHETYAYLNPGSVSIPKEDSWHGYMTLEGGEFVWKTLEGEEKMTYRAL